MTISDLAIQEVILLEPRVFKDARGHFFESYNQRVLESVIGRHVQFVQDNQSRSARSVIRGLHYQVNRPQGKLVRVVRGEIFDVAVDIRRSSPSFGQWVGGYLSESNRKQMWIPEGFAHGFVVLSEEADVLYKTTDYWSPENERCIAWNDPVINIDWQISSEPIVSAKDKAGLTLSEAEVFP